MDNVFEESPKTPFYNIQEDQNNENVDQDAEDVSLGCSRQRANSRLKNDEPDQPKIRAKSARDLVKSQEHLLNLLQSMKSDISKMDREANRIKEDIIRSNQLFHVMVKMEKAHHLQRLPGGYNISHSLPREIYQRYRYTSRELDTRYLDYLASSKPRYFSDNSRRSSVSSRDYVNYQSLDHSYSAPESRRPSTISRNSNSSSNESYSGNSATESEIESSIPRRLPRAESSSNISQDSDYIYGEAGSSTESVSTVSTFSRNVRASNSAGRRCSYFYTTRADASPQVQSDEVDL